MPTFNEIYKKRFGNRVPVNGRLKHGQEHTLDAFIDKLEASGDTETLDQFQVLLWRLCLVTNRANYFGDEMQKLLLEKNKDAATETAGSERMDGKADTGTSSS